jgi:uncharacterized membrane protein YdjX (TVP38/TMEM64 family)
MRGILFFLLIVLSLIAYFSGFDEYFSLSELQQHHVNIKNFITLHPKLAPCLFIVLYTIITTLALPVDTFLVILGGYLFSEPCSLIYVVIGSSTGATCLFLVAKTAMGGFFFKWASPFLKKLEKGFQRNAAFYMLSLRLAPIFPFWLANISPAFFGIPLFTYYWTTLIGVIPFAFVFTQVGTGLSAVMDAHQSLTIENIFNTNVKIALLGLAILSLFPLIFGLVQKEDNSIK